ncbi:MAG: ABC transporter substrate-binding protein [Anaeromyxobacteraceae bacterium]
MTHPKRALALSAALLAARAGAAAPREPAPAPEVVEAARREGVVVVHATTDKSSAAPLLEGFAALHPELRVEYEEMNTAVLHERALAAARGGGGVARGADVLWSSAMDLQMKLANDGYALPYASPEARFIPTWAVWKDEAFGTTFEPLGFVYDARRLAAGEVPASHAQLAREVRANPERWRGKIATYDPARSGIGFLVLTQDERTDRGFVEAARAYGDAGVKLHATTAEMVRRVAAGELLLGFEAIGSYALLARRSDPAIGIAYPRDYTLVLSRIALIPKSAPHPNAARVFLDWLLSARGQELLARASVFAIRRDVEGEATAAALTRSLGRSLRPIPVSPSLLLYLDHAKRADFLRRWEAAVAPRTKGP